MEDRTIANELQNGSTQSSLSCKICRKRKLKCNRVLPKCQNCSKSNVACEYPKVAHKPGPRPGTHRRAATTRNGTRTARRMLPALSSNGVRDDQTSPSSSGLHDHGSEISKDSFSQSTPHDLLSPEQGASLFGISVSIACKKMQVPEKSCLKMIEAYLENMSSFVLFHPPTFRNKLASIESAKQTEALLTSMLAFAIRFIDSRDMPVGYDMRPTVILEKAYSLSQECMNECTDDVPPLHLLQAMLIQTLLLSSLGVRGKAYRLAGQSVRLAYELRLHELDLDLQTKDAAHNSSSADTPHDWILIEEKRRAWWAAWECDVFAGTIQRLPMQIDWTRNRTCLPSPDESWFDGRPIRSCYLHIDPNKRWKNLRDTGNTSPIAWFVLFNSYKWESLSVTQRIAPPTNFFDGEDKSDCVDPKPILLRKREMLENCLRCALGAIPRDLQPDGLLTFDLVPGPCPALRRTRDYGRYMVFIMSQVTQLLLSRKDLQGGNYIAFPADFSERVDDRNHRASAIQDQDRNLERRRWQQCLVASDKITQIVRNSIPESYRYVSPNAATALWMAAATQVAVLAFHRDEIDVDLAQSNLDLLTTTIEDFIRFWDVPDTLVRSIGALKQHLDVMSSKQAEMAQDGGNVAGVYGDQGRTPASVDSQLSQEMTGFAPLNSTGKMPNVGDGDFNLELSPFDILQAMDFGAMYNGVENWENLFLDPGFPATGLGY